MNTSHPSQETLEGFFAGSLPSDSSRTVVRHLIGGCSECKETTGLLWEHLITGRQARRPNEAEYDGAFDRAWTRATSLADQFRHEREIARHRCAELLALSPNQRRLLVSNDPRYQTLAVCDALSAESERRIFDDAAVAMNLASLANEVADGLNQDVYGAATISDAKARAWATFANAQRVSSDLEGAEQSLRTAQSYLDAGTGDPTRKAQYLGSLGVLLKVRRRFEEALEIYRELEGIYISLDDDHMVGRVQLKKAMVFGKMRQSDQEISLLRRALGLLDPARDPRRQTIVLHNLVLALIDAGRPEEANEYMPALETLHAEQGGKLILLRFKWLRGRLAHAQGDLDSAEELYAEVRDAFVDLEIGMDVALASLDLAEVLSDSGDLDQARLRLREAIPILKALGFHGEALAALAFLETCVFKDSFGGALIRRTAAFMRKVQNDPEARFTPGEIVEN